MRRVSDALGRLEAVEVGLLALDVDGVERVEAEPRREGEPALVRQLRDRRQDDRLKTEETVVHFDGRQHPFWTAVRTAFGVGSGKQVSHSDVMGVEVKIRSVTGPKLPDKSKPHLPAPAS